jgi:hypothetical protein
MPKLNDEKVTLKLTLSRKEWLVMFIDAGRIGVQSHEWYRQLETMRDIALPDAPAKDAFTKVEKTVKVKRTIKKRR